jgi:hypothetical protein
VQQGSTRLAHNLQPRALCRREFVARHDLDHAQHAVERRAYLMAHDGQELALCLTRRLGLFKGLCQLQIAALAVGNVPQAADQGSRAAAFIS